MNIQWIFRKDIDRDEVKKFADELQIPRMIASLLLSRGKKENILIYGDYDVDGVTSTSAIYIFLTKLGGEVSFYIPDRETEGYGLSIKGIKEGIARGVSLIISVDCGITGHKEILFAKENNVDFIISDHHEPSDTLPEALAILNPKQTDDNYPFKELAGVGVVFKLIQGVVKKAGLDDSFAENLIDIVAVGTIADVVPMIGENRLLVKKGLEKINSSPSLGIKTLIDAAGMTRNNISTWNIIYGISPRLNAAGRLDHAEKGVHLLITNDINEALNIAYFLETQNRKRQTLDSSILKDALSIVNEQFNPEKSYTIILAKENWHQGVIGICASRIMEKFYRPTIMLSITNGIGKGSARSIPEFDIYSALKNCSEHIIEFGGHKFAAGLTIKKENIEKFISQFEEFASKELSHDILVPKLKIDGYIVLDDINDEIIRFLKYLEPFGPQNEKPLFAAKKLQVVGVPKVLNNNHLKFKVRDQYMIFDAIGFGMGKFKEQIENNIDMVFYIGENVWGGKKTIQLNVKDIRVSTD